MVIILNKETPSRVLFNFGNSIQQLSYAFLCYGFIVMSFLPLIKD